MLFVGRGLESHLVFLLRFPSKGPFIFKGVGGLVGFYNLPTEIHMPPPPPSDLHTIWGDPPPIQESLMQLWENFSCAPPLKPLFFGWPPLDPTSPSLPKKWTVPNVFQFVNSPYHFYYNNIILSIIYLYFSIIDCNLHFIIIALFYFGFKDVKHTWSYL